MWLLLYLVTAAAAAADPLGAFNVDADSLSVSGISSGGFMAAQLGIAYSDIFKGFGVFAGGPYDCARNQLFTACMLNGHPSIDAATQHMRAWDGQQIGPLANLDRQRIFLEVGALDITVGPNVMSQLRAQLGRFVDGSNVSYVTTPGQAHTFPTDFDAAGNNLCALSGPPFVSNCGYDGAGAVLQWMYGALRARNDGPLSARVVPFDQTGAYGTEGLDSTGYIYVPQSCAAGTACKLHIALHGCSQSASQVGTQFVDNAGYNRWADTNDIIVLYPQTVVDNTPRIAWSGLPTPNSNACWDWIGWYGDDADQIGGKQMTALLNQAKQVMSG